MLARRLAGFDCAGKVPAYAVPHVRVSSCKILRQKDWGHESLGDIFAFGAARLA